MKDYVKSTECEKSMNKKTINKPVWIYIPALNPQCTLKVQACNPTGIAGQCGQGLCIAYIHICTMRTLQHSQALTCHYLDVLNKELHECSLHPLALPAENLRLLVLECLVGSRAAVQLAHMR